MIFLVVTTACHARNYTLGMWTISVDKASKKVDIYSTEYGDTPLFENVSARLWTDKSEKPHTSLHARKLTVSQTGNCLTLRSTLPDNTILIQKYIADGQFLEVSLAATRKGAIISTNRMEPFHAQHVNDFMSEHLRPAGFAGNDGLMVLSLDSWWSDNISESQIREFVDYCHKNNFMPGLYFTPFADFATWDHPLRGIEGFTSKDIWLKVDDKPLTLDGAYALDPTHPATQTMMRQKMKRFRQWGIEYLKCDFMSHGALEADRWYDDEVTTGMQAYNMGMQLLQDLAGEDIFIDLSISPLFPYQYAHGRRICCQWAGGSMDYILPTTPTILSFINTTPRAKRLLARTVPASRRG